MSYKGIIDEEAKYYLKYRKNTKEDAAYRAWRIEWRRKGILKFAEEVLRVDPENGGKLMLSEAQKNFLTRVTTDVDLAIVCSGRSSGKTFSLAIFVAYHIFVHEHYNITCIGGSQDQADAIQEYIKGWIRENPILEKFIWKNVKKTIKTYANSKATFSGLSPTATRSKHVQCLIIDEAAAGDENGKTKYMKAAVWQVASAKEGQRCKIFKVSTIHAVSGDFLDTWNHAEELGYTKFTWSLAKHISGEKDPYKVYMDTNPHHWVSNVPWGNDGNIQKVRKGATNAEWLVEGLGAVSKASGLVFNPADIDAAVCNECQECNPYKCGCTLLPFYLMKAGIDDKRIVPSKDNPKYMETAKAYLDEDGEKCLGIDWNKIHPDCYSDVERFRDELFVMDFRDPTGQSDEEKIETAQDICNNRGIEIIRPDPEQWSYANDLLNLGYAVHQLWTEGGQEKQKYVAYITWIFEHHKIHIPKAYTGLIDCLRRLTFDDKNKIVKKDDHQFDSLLYAVSYFRELDGDSIPDSGNDDRGAKVWTKQTHPTIPVEKIIAPKPEASDSTTVDIEEEEPDTSNTSDTPTPVKPQPRKIVPQKELTVEEKLLRQMLTGEMEFNSPVPDEDNQSQNEKDFNPFDEEWLKKRREKTTYYEGGACIW